MKKKQKINYAAAGNRGREGDKIMTNREFFVAVANGEMTEEIRQHASEQIEKMAAADERRRNKPSKTAEANAPLVEALIKEFLHSEPQLGADLADKLNEKFPDLEKPVTPQKVASMLRSYVAGGVVGKEDVKVDKTTKVGYRLL